MNKYTYTILIMSILALFVGTVVGQGDVNAGKTVFDSRCGSCHMLTGTTGTGPNMTVLSSDSASDIRTTVRNGVNATPQMPAFSTTSLSDSDLNNVIAYIEAQNISVSMTVTPYPITSTATTNTTPMMTTPAMNVTPVMTTPAMNATPAMTTAPVTTTVEETTTVETPLATPAPTPTPKAPGFGFLLGIIGILLIYSLRKHR